MFALTGGNVEPEKGNLLCVLLFFLQLFLRGTHVNVSHLENLCLLALSAPWNEPEPTL